MYQYGNLAVQYQNEKRRVREAYASSRPRTQTLPTTEKVRVYYGLSVGEKILYITALAIVVAALSLLLASNASISQLNYEIQFLEKEISQVKEMNANLLVEVAALSSPDRIIAIATTELGLNQEKSTVRILSHSQDRKRSLEQVGE